MPDWMLRNNSWTERIYNVNLTLEKWGWLGGQDRNGPKGRVGRKGMWGIHVGSREEIEGWGTALLGWGPGCDLRVRKVLMERWSAARSSVSRWGGDLRLWKKRSSLPDAGIQVGKWRRAKMIFKAGEILEGFYLQRRLLWNCRSWTFKLEL